MRPIMYSAVVAGAAAAAASIGTGALRSADHGDSASVRGNPQLDINDVYVFPGSAEGRTCVVMTVCPVAGITGPVVFARGARYVFHVDLDGDALPDGSIASTFGRPDAAGAQPWKLEFRGFGPRFRASATTGGVPADLENGARVAAGVFDDPFFFDLLAFRAGLAFDSDGSINFFRGLNTLALVVEVPDEIFGGAGTIGVWCSTSTGRTQADRMGRPAINTVLVTSARKDAFNRAQPRDDAAFRSDAAAIIASLNGGDAETAAGLAEFLFPDILTYSPGSAPGFPNGRRLEDDVIDAELQLLTGDPSVSDFVGNDSAFREEFPYLAPKNP